MTEEVKLFIELYPANSGNTSERIDEPLSALLLDAYSDRSQFGEPALFLGGKGHTPLVGYNRHKKKTDQYYTS
ncbi:MAG: hypothetical protein ACFFCZ_22060 [Promethearchaeota archaeon]